MDFACVIRTFDVMSAAAAAGALSIAKGRTIGVRRGAPVFEVCRAARDNMLSRTGCTGSVADITAGAAAAGTAATSVLFGTGFIV